jgi:selenocysteine lyase/cysteine desulfurase
MGNSISSENSPEAASHGSGSGNLTDGGQAADHQTHLASDKAGHEAHFRKFRSNCVGVDVKIVTPYGTMKCVYADWTASGRLYRPIERFISDILGRYVANTHTETSTTGLMMTEAYEMAKAVIKKHVNANADDVIIFQGSGMTCAVQKFQRILGLHVPEKLRDLINVPDDMVPVVFVTHYEHHSNQASWESTYCIVEIVPPDERGRVSVDNFRDALMKHRDRKIKIASISACSNVTGARTPYQAIARLMHQEGGHCFVDFAASFGYTDIDMHPEDPDERLDAMFCSPHKLLGGPGASGVCIFSEHLYNLKRPEAVGGGVFRWTSPNHTHGYVYEVAVREDAGTPGFLQAIRAAKAVQLKEEMGVRYILAREEYINALVFRELKDVPNITIYAADITDRQSIFAFNIEGMSYHLVCRILNDYFGIQARGGCSCAGTYGHILLNLTEEMSEKVINEIDEGNNGVRPGWCRISFHPIMTNHEVMYILESVKKIAANADSYCPDYTYDFDRFVFVNKHESSWAHGEVRKWFQNAPI